MAATRSPNDNCSRQRSVEVQQVGAGEQFMRLSMPNCDPVSLTLAVFYDISVIFSRLAHSLQSVGLHECPLPQS